MEEKCLPLLQNTRLHQGIFFYIHGGGYLRGPMLQHWKYINNLIKETGATVSLIIYPKTPEHNFKDAYNCISLAYDEVLKTCSANDIIVMGDSAGGALALGLAQLLRNNAKQQPHQLILFFPWLDLSLRDPDIKKFEDVDPMLDRDALQRLGVWYANNEDPKNPLLSPLYAELTGIPPITIITGTYDILWTDIWKFWDKAKEKNFAVDYYKFDKMIHGFTHINIPEAKQAMDIVIKKVSRK